MCLGLCTKGFNPFRSFVASYSCWLVILTIYNLPPGICMRSKFIFLSTVIPDPNSSGQNIDVYLQPLLLNDKEIFILLLWCELVLLCCVCNYEFKYLQDEHIKNTNIIWHQTLFTPIEIMTDCTLYEGIPAECVCRYILVTMETVSLLLDTIHDIH